MDLAYRKQLRDLVHLRPGHADLWSELGHAHLLNGDADAALAALERALRINPGFVEAGIGRAFALAAAGRKTEAYATLRPWFTRSPADPDVVFAIGVFCMRFGWHHTGIAQLRRATTLRPKAVHFRHHLAAALSILGDAEAAEVELRRAALENAEVLRRADAELTIEPLRIDDAKLMSAPGTARSHVGLVQFLHRSDRHAEEALALAEVLRAYPAHPVVLVEVGRLVLRRGDAAKARGWFEGALMVLPECDQAMVELSLLAVEAGAMDEGVSWLQKAVDLRPMYPDLRVDLGTLLLDLGRVEEAITHLREAHALAPADSHAAMRLATACLSIGDVAAAHRALDAGPWREWTECLVLRAEACLREGNLEQARRWTERALEREPDHPSARELLQSVGA
jgi:Flp pilus assembly protein TadD